MGLAYQYGQRYHKSMGDFPPFLWNIGRGQHKVGRWQVRFTNWFLVDISSDGFINQLGTGVLTFMIPEHEGIAQKQDMELP